MTLHTGNSNTMTLHTGDSNAVTAVTGQIISKEIIVCYFARF